MRYRPRQVCLCDPNRLLSSLPRFSAHCHARSLLPTVVNHSTIYDENPDLHHGLLGYAQNNQVRLYGEVFDLVSDPVSVGENFVFVDGLERKLGHLRRVRIPSTIVEMARKKNRAA